MDIELNELAGFLNETKESEDIKFSGMFTDKCNVDTIFEEGISFDENDIGYFEFSDAFYNDLENTLVGSIRPNEALIIIENDEERRKLHCGYDGKYDTTTPSFDKTKIVGCINSDLEFTQNENASLRVEKPVSLKLEK
jgi:hypothetical protein